MHNQFYQGLELQNCFYPSFTFLRCQYLNQQSFGFLLNTNLNSEIFYSPLELKVQSPTTTFTTLERQDIIPIEKRNQEREKSQQNEKKQKKSQYVGRNDFSNMFKSFLFLVFKSEKTKTYIKNLIKKLDLSISLNTFSNKLKRKFPDSKTYIGPKQIRKFFSKLQMNQFAGQKSIATILKILLKGFLENEYKLYVIKKYKGKNQSKKQIFNKCRILYKQVFSQDEESK